jgi:hypothetical protein
LDRHAESEGNGTGYVKVVRARVTVLGRVVYSCVRCGALFEATRPNRKYCDGCKVNHHNKRDIHRAAKKAGMPADIGGR